MAKQFSGLTQGLDVNLGGSFQSEPEVKENEQQITT